MNNETRQILKNQATIMVSLIDILDNLKIPDLQSVISIQDRMKETSLILHPIKKEVEDVF